MASKLGFHVQQPHSPDWLKEHVRRSGCEWVKLMDPDAGAFEPFGSSVAYIGRLYFGRGEPDKELIAQGAAGADTWFAMAQPRMAACPWCAIWEGPNEPYVSTETQAHALASFESRRVELLHQANLKAVSFMFGTGNPPYLSLWRILGSALEDTDYLGLHEYGMRRMNLDGWHLLRYRKAIRELGDAGHRIPGILITETGIDYNGDPVNDGWRAQGITEAEYLAQLAAYDQELQQDPEILAATPFTWMDVGWPSFTITPAMSHLLAGYMHEQNTTLEGQLGEAIQAYVIPQNAAAAFYRYGRGRGWEPISPERDFTIDGVTYRAQAFYTPDDEMQHIAYTEIGNWANVRHFDREN